MVIFVLLYGIRVWNIQSVECTTKGLNKHKHDVQSIQKRSLQLL
jgi:hypothetical protein